MWDLPEPGIESVSPALAGRFFTAGPPGKSEGRDLICVWITASKSVPISTEYTQSFH